MDIIQVYCRDFRVDEFYIITPSKRKLAQLLAILHINCSAQLSSVLFDSQPDLRGRNGGWLFTYSHTCMFSCVASVLCWYRQTIFLEGLALMFFNILWVFFFWGLIFLSAWVISSQRKCLISHIWTQPMSSQTTHPSIWVKKRWF